MKNTRTMSGALTLSLLSLIACAACSNVRNFLAADSSKDVPKPISNPFGDYQANGSENPNDTMIFRSRRGDKAVEVEIPRANQGVTDFVLPAPQGTSASRRLASVENFEGESPAPTVENTYAKQAPTASDRELTRDFSKTPFEEEQRRNDIERGLGLVSNNEMTPERQTSYLASLDHVKQLYRTGRFEAGLIEVDSMIRDFPTDPKLHAMRGTLLDRLGRKDLALKSWNQALRFDPENASLRRFVERRAPRQPASATASSQGAAQP